MLPGKPKSTTSSGHYHRTFSEAFFVLDGSVALYDGQTWRDANAGDYLFVPPGGVHSFANTSGQAASMLILFAPGAPRDARHDQFLA